MEYERIKIILSRVKLTEIIEELSIYFDDLVISEPYMYFSGEFDSNQSDFEKKSNNLEIGVICGNEDLAMVLMLLVRCISYGDYIDFFSGYMSQYKNQDLTIEEIFTNLVNYERFNKISEKFPIQTSYERVLTRSEKGKIIEILVEKRIDEIDIWTLPRILEYVQNF